MNDTVILTFTYPLIEPYFEDFLKSCETQTNKEFDIIIVNDGLTSLQSMIDCHPSLNVSITLIPQHYYKIFFLST